MKKEGKRYLTLDEVLRTVPPGDRPRVVAEAKAILSERKRTRRWMTEQVESTLAVPDIVYKYIPRRLLSEGSPWTLRATQPVTLNGVMECNVMTMKEDTEMDRDHFSLPW